MTMLRFTTIRSAAPLMLVAAFALAAGVLATTETASAAPAPGQEESAAEDPEAIRPFTIDVSDAVLADLKDRLSRTRLPDELPGTEWDYGTNRAYLEELIAYWRDEFEWRDQEWLLNGFDHFKTDIDGLDVHFIHQRSPHEDSCHVLSRMPHPGRCPPPPPTTTGTPPNRARPAPVTDTPSPAHPAGLVNPINPVGQPRLPLGHLRGRLLDLNAHTVDLVA